MKTRKEQKNILFINSNRTIIDLDPIFQRGAVWNEKKRALFIDTLLKGWGVPKIYLAAYRDKDNLVYRYECIDGKQRLISVFDFYDSKLKVSINNKELTYGELTIKEKEHFSKYKFDFEIVEDFSNDELSELFQRLQSGLVLNTSEKLKAITGEMSNFVFALSEGSLFKNKLASKAKRNPHLATVTQVCLLSIKNDIVNLKFKDLSSFLMTYKKFNNRGEEAKKIKNTLSFIDKNFTIEDARIVFTNRAMFVSCFYLISYLALRGDIKKMKINEFFIDFAKKLSNNKTDPSLKDFQSAVIQGADSASSVKTRHNILLKRIVKFDKEVESVVNYETLDEEFRKVYGEKLYLYGGSHTKLNNELLSLGCKRLKTSRGETEALPVYIRHSQEHPSKSRKQKFSNKELQYSIDILRKIF